MNTWFDWFISKTREQVSAFYQARGLALPKTRDGKEDLIAGFACQMDVLLRAYAANPAQIAVHNGGPQQMQEFATQARLMIPFLYQFLPTDVRQRWDTNPAMGPDRGYVCTRDTAELFSNARGPSADPWIQRLFAPSPVGEGLGGIYIDVPHAALRICPAEQVRAIFVIPWSDLDETSPIEPGSTPRIVRSGEVLMGIVKTPLASEQGAGFAFGTVTPDNVHRVPTLEDGTQIGHILPPSGAGFESVADYQHHLFGRALDFVRLVLAYSHYGPAASREPVLATPAREIASRGRPRKGESIFAMTRLAAPKDRLGRPPRPGGGGWRLDERQPVEGHFRLVAHGPGGRERRLTWIEPYVRGPEGAATRPRAVWV